MANQADKSNPAGKPRLLLVDDEATVREALGRLLQTEGYEVILAASGREAIQTALEWPVDLVLLDVNMAIQNGWETSQRLTNAQPDLPIIMITANPGAVQMPAATRVEGVMEKPLDLPLLLATIRNLLSARQADHSNNQPRPVALEERK
jgi:CheY-like chemotaxis protein